MNTDKLFRYIDNPNFRSINLSVDYKHARNDFREISMKLPESVEIDKTRMSLKFPSGATVFFSVINNMSDAYRWAGMQFQYIHGINKAKESHQYMVAMIRTHDNSMELGYD